jgi:hypothetical protein
MILLEKDNISMDLWKTGCEDVKWTEQAMHRANRKSFLAMNFLSYTNRILCTNE